MSDDNLLELQEKSSTEGEFSEAHLIVLNAKETRERSPLKSFVEIKRVASLYTIFNLLISILFVL